MDAYEWEVAWPGPPMTVRGKTAYRIERTQDSHNPLRLWIDGKNGDDDEDSFSIAGPDLLAKIMELAPEPTTDRGSNLGGRMTIPRDVESLAEWVEALARGQNHLERRLADLAKDATTESARIRAELWAWLVGDRPEDAGLICGRRVVPEIDRICPEGKEE